MCKYDVALSYESKIERTLQEVTDYLKGEKWNIFFAPYNKNELLSENLLSKLFQVYQNESLVKVLFVTKEYLESPYTKLEKRRSLSSTVKDRRRLIVINFIGELLPEELKPFVYLEGNSSTDEIALMISDRVRELKKRNSEYYLEEENSLRIKNINCITNNLGIVAGDNVKIENLNIK